MFRRDTLTVAFFAWLASFSLVASAQQQPQRQVAAMVNGQPIFVDQVMAGVQKATQGKSVPQQAVPALQAQTLNQLIQQELVARFLVQQKIPAGDLEIATALQNIAARFQQQGTTLEKYLQERGATEKQLREQLAGQIRWRNYLQQALDEKRLKEFFEANHRQFDGTELRVSHILLRNGSELALPNAESAIEKANQIREEIESGKLDFAAAAEKYSSGPSRQQGGDLGFIPRRGVMQDSFSQAAFALEKDEISQPVSTSFGVHLIQVTEVKPGDKTWQDVQGQLRQQLAGQLMQEVAQREWPAADIRFSGATAYYMPGKGLVIPSGGQR